MARIEGVDLPRDKRVVIGLTYIYGIGKSTSQKLLDGAGIDHSTRVRELSESEVQRLRELIGSLTIEGDLRRQTQLNIKRLMEINSYRGLRHRRRLAGSRAADQDQRSYAPWQEADGCRAWPPSWRHQEVGTPFLKGDARKRLSLST